MKISLDDVINLPTDVLIGRINLRDKEVPQPTSPAVQLTHEEVAAVTPSEVIMIETPETVSRFNVNLLRGRFTKGTIFSKNDAHMVDNYTIRIVGMIPSANRVKFKVEELGTTHSIPLNDLTGETSEFPYKKGDKVNFNGEECEVKRINPANANVVLWHEGKYKYVKIRKVTPV